MENVFAYLRVSSSGQTNGDGFTRQEKACRDYCKQNNMNIQTIFKEDMTGTEEDRPILAELMISLQKNNHGVKTVVIEKLDRLARDLMVQEAIVRDFQKKGFNLVSALEGNDLLGNDPTRKLVRQVFGAIAEYEKSMLVSKLRVARERKKIETGKCGGRNGYKDSEVGKAILQRIKELRRKPRNGKPRTYREVADVMNSEGLRTIDGKEWTLHRVHQVENDS